jgi:hypothetical protein
MQLRFVGQIANHDYRVILNPDVCYIHDCRTGHLVGTGPVGVIHNERLWVLDDLVFLLLLHPRRHLLSAIVVVWFLTLCFTSLRPFRISFGSRVFRSLSRLSIGQTSPASLSL